ncbi:MAG: methyltransferase domain-containing protein [Thermoplasmata archaeon]|nr:methyltransferase domain-containing protein [Thermoplasmata archaeon]
MANASRDTPHRDVSAERERLALNVLERSLGLAALRAAIELEVFDHLEETSRPIALVAQEVGCDASSLARLLRISTLQELVAEPERDQFALRPLGRHLRKDSAESERDFLTFILHPFRARALERLADAVRHGRTAIEEEYGLPEFEYLAQHPDLASVFQRAMVAGTNNMARAFLRAFSFEGAHQVADVGGGHGELLGAVLRQYPQMTGILFDLPYAVEGARAHIEELGLTARCRIFGGSFFESVPAGADVYLLKSVLHNWPDPRAVEILRNVRTAMPPHGRLLIVERLLPSARGPDQAFAMDLNMLAFPGGRERMQSEYERLLQSAGLRLLRVISTPDQSILETAPG